MVSNWSSTTRNVMASGSRNGSKVLNQRALYVCVAGDVRVSQLFHAGIDKYRNPVFERVPVKYDLVINARQGREAQYATIVHELAHLYCGHLGTPNDQWWPDRRGLRHDIQELEAESVTYMVCLRSGIDNPSEQYLAGYVGQPQNGSIHQPGARDEGSRAY